MLFVGLVAILSAFLAPTATGTSWISVALLCAIVALFVLSDRLVPGASVSPAGPDLALPEEERFEKLLDGLEEAHELFGSSLNQDDMFRLLSSRIAGIAPSAATALIQPTGRRLRVLSAAGRNAPFLVDYEMASGEGLASLVLERGSVEIDGDLFSDRAAMPPENLDGFTAAAAIPLIGDDGIYGVFEMFFDDDHPLAAVDTSCLEVIGERLSPILQSAMAADASLSGALTDPLTELPNERAFYIVLENQLAESHRYRAERPVTVLAIDIKQFAEFNDRYGHATGDRLLSFVAATISEQLRKMDFLARTVNDEFVIVLPTAGEDMAVEIMDRIQARFTTKPFELAENESTKVWLNFGVATFWRDGETAQQLLNTATLRKQQAKAGEPNKVIWFPKEYVN
jgi:diguanylate cyclase (GGDEF)-like protein